MDDGDFFRGRIVRPPACEERADRTSPRAKANLYHLCTSLFLTLFYYTTVAVKRKVIHTPRFYPLYSRICCWNTDPATNPTATAATKNSAAVSPQIARLKADIKMARKTFG